MSACIKCGSTKNLTVDHIVPQWLYGRTHLLGISVKIILASKKNKQIMCKRCNNKKAGNIEWDHPIVHKYFNNLIEHIQRKLTNNPTTPHSPIREGEIKHKV